MGSRNRDYCGHSINPSPMRDDPDDGSREELAEYYAGSLCVVCVRHDVDCPLDPTGPVLDCVEYRAKEQPQ